MLLGDICPFHLPLCLLMMDDTVLFVVVLWMQTRYCLCVCLPDTRWYCIETNVYRELFRLSVKGITSLLEAYHGYKIPRGRGVEYTGV